MAVGGAPIAVAAKFKRVLRYGHSWLYHIWLLDSQHVCTDPDGILSGLRYGLQLLRLRFLIERKQFGAYFI